MHLPFKSFKGINSSVIVGLAFIVIAEHFVGSVDLFVVVSSLFVSWVLVRVVLFAETPVRLLDVSFGRLPRNLQ